MQCRSDFWRLYVSVTGARTGGGRVAVRRRWTGADVGGLLGGAVVAGGRDDVVGAVWG
jgi:hypothetical protein